MCIYIATPYHYIFCNKSLQKSYQAVVIYYLQFVCDGMVYSSSTDI